MDRAQIRSALSGPIVGIHATLEIFGLAERWWRNPYASLSNTGTESLSHFFHTKGLL